MAPSLLSFPSLDNQFEPFCAINRPIVQSGVHAITKPSVRYCRPSAALVPSWENEILSPSRRAAVEPSARLLCFFKPSRPREATHEYPRTQKSFLCRLHTGV